MSGSRSGDGGSSSSSRAVAVVVVVVVVAVAGAAAASAVVVEVDVGSHVHCTCGYIEHGPLFSACWRLTKPARFPGSRSRGQSLEGCVASSLRSCAVLCWG